MAKENPSTGIKKGNEASLHLDEKQEPCIPDVPEDKVENSEEDGTASEIKTHEAQTERD